MRYKYAEDKYIFKVKTKFPDNSTRNIDGKNQNFGKFK